ncbi:MG2 domain-containing protein [Bacterioplanoides sp.]|uniref:alpha-2-macroglobulin family protein n=1 Tax=Bacterioplanoides sp. TaxID=2066072 RepID=UPI003AFFE7EC
MTSLCHSMIVAFLLISSLAQAASFDCSQATTSTEKAICSDAAVSQLDSELGRLYGQLEKEDSLTQAQRSWVLQRNQCLDSNCLKQKYQQRIKQLKQAFMAQQYKGQPQKISTIKEESWNNGPAIVVRVTVPVDASSNWRQTLSLQMDNVALNPQDWVLDSNGLALIYPFIEPDREFKVKIKPGLKAVNGRTLVQPGDASFRSRRTQPSVSFNGDGYVLSDALRRALPVTTLNVNEVDLEIFRIQPELIGQWIHYSHQQREGSYSLNRFAQETEMVFSGRFPIEHQRNQRTTTNLDLSEIAALQQSGAYVAVLSSPGLYKSRFSTNFFTISDIGLSVRRNSKIMRVNANSIKTGEPLPDILLSIYNGKKLLGQQPTNALGEAEFESFYSKGNTLVAQQGKQYTVIDFKHSPLDLSAFENPTTRHQSLQVFSWGPRNLYRPGETVDVFALLKDFDGKKTAPLPLDVALYDATSNRVVKRTLSPSRSGRYEFSYKLDDNVKTGNWRLEFSSEGSKELRHRYEFSVEEFMPERLKLTLFDGDDKAYRQTASKDEVNIPLLGEYLYGAPASGNKYDALVIAELEKHPFEQWKSYYFGLAQEKVRPRQQKIYSSKLDDSGKGEIKIPMNQWRNIKSPLSLIASVSLYESGGRPVTRRTVVTNILSEELIGLEPQFDGRADDNSRATFKAILTDNQGKLLSGNHYQYRLIRENRNYYWRYSDSRGWSWEYDPLHYEVFSGSLEFDGQVPAVFTVPVEWGRYRLEVQDKRGNIITTHRFSTRWSGWGYNNSDSMKPDQVMMQLDRDVYQPGERATLTVIPAVDGLGFITLESNNEILWRQQLNVSAKGTDIQIDIDKNWQRHDLYFTATVLTPGDMKHAVAPKRALGLLHLPLQRPDAALNIEIKVPERVQPKRSVTAELQMTADFDPASDVWVSLAAVDVGVLNIKRFQTPDPLSYWFSPRRYDYQLYDVYGKIIENAGFDYSSQRFGGGRFKKSAAELVRGGDKPKNDVQIISLQAQAIRFDSDGKASVELEIPDFNGTLRWMAVAWSDNAYGSNEAEMQVADALVTQLSRPRFLAPGDTSEISLDLSNQSGAQQQFKVEFSVEGVLQAQQWQQEVDLADKQRKVLNFPITAEKIGKGSIHARVVNVDNTIEIDKAWSIYTRSAYPSVIRKQMAVIEPGAPWQPTLSVEGLIPDSVQARLAISSQPPIDIGSHFDALLRYPYGCTEQTTSSGYPWVSVTPELAERFKLKEKIEKQFKAGFDQAFRRGQMEAAVDRLLKRQGNSGGFALWSNSGNEINWLTVYVTDFLTAARDAGAKVPHSSLQRATQRLRSYLSGSTNIHYSYSDSQEYYRFATQAYAAYVLARSNQASLSQLRRLYKQQENTDARSGLPWAHLGYALQKAGDNELAKKVFNKAKLTGYRKGYYGYYGSELRDASLLYAVLAKAGVAEGQQLLAIFDIARQRTWLSTQERNALFQAAIASTLDQQGTTEALLATSDFKQEISEKGIFSSLIDYAQLNSIENISSRDSTLYASLELIGEHQVPPTPYSNEIAISRDYFDVDGKPLQLQQLTAGDLVLVRLTVSAGRSLPDALVVDLLPAGLELENQNLADASVDMSKLMIDGRRVADWQSQSQVEHMEYRDDRFVAAVPLNEYRSRELFYLARAVTPGEYRVPPPYAEDMYRPFYHALGTAPGTLTIKP